jgi:competence protein ComEA
VVLGLCALGTLWDLAHLRAVPAPPAPAVAADEAVAPADPATAEPAAAPVAPARVDLNRADARALDALPGIGPVLAARIVQRRSEHGAFGSVDELLSVPGIGPRLLERLRPRVTVSATAGAPPAGVRNATPVRH